MIWRNWYGIKHGLKNLNDQLRLALNINDNNESLIKLFSKLKMENLENLKIQLRCPLDAYEIHKVVIRKLGKNLQKLRLSCDCVDGCSGDYIELDMDQIKTILAKCPDLKKLEISGRHLPTR